MLLLLLPFAKKGSFSRRSRPRQAQLHLQPRHVLPAGTNRPQPNAIRLVDLEAPLGPEIVPGLLQGSRGRVSALAVSPDSRWLAAGDDERRIQLYDLQGAGQGDLQSTSQESPAPRTLSSEMVEPPRHGGASLP